MRPLHPLRLVVHLCLVLVGGCGGDDTSALDTSRADTSEVVDDPCVPLALDNLGALVFDGQDDVSTSFSYPLVDAPFSAPLPDHLVLQFINYNERIGELAMGTFALDAAPNDNFGTCPECIAIWVDQPTPSAPVGKILFQSAGAITLELDPRTRRLKGRIEGLRFREITIDEQTLSSTFVEGGACARMTQSLTFDFTWVPPEWSCEPGGYNDGGDCDCDCGAIDPDCYPLEAPPLVPSDDCDDGDLCYLGDCVATCSNAEPRVGCETGELCKPDAPSDICQPRGALVSPADVGEPCQGNTTQFCGPIGTNVTGICDIDAEQRTCEPLCTTRADCEVGEHCYTLFVGGGTQRGFCKEGLPPEWFACDAAQYRDGATCHCGCGTDDPDCDDGAKPVVGCDPGQTCNTRGECE